MGRKFLAFFENKSDDYLYLYIRNLENTRLNSVFRLKISNLVLCGLVENSKWIFVVEKHVINVCIYDFLCTNIIFADSL